MPDDTVAHNVTA